jgi:hypothetical protein
MSKIVAHKITVRDARFKDGSVILEITGDAK